MNFVIQFDEKKRITFNNKETIKRGIRVVNTVDNGSEFVAVIPAIRPASLVLWSGSEYDIQKNTDGFTENSVRERINALLTIETFIKRDGEPFPDSE